MSNEFHIFLPDNPCRKVGLAESQYKWSTPQERPGCDLLVKRTSAMMVHGIGRMKYDTFYKSYKNNKIIYKRLFSNVNEGY